MFKLLIRFESKKQITCTKLAYDNRIIEKRDLRLVLNKVRRKKARLTIFRKNNS